MVISHVENVLTGIKRHTIRLNYNTENIVFNQKPS